MYASDYRAQARSVLSGNWLLSALTAFIAALLGGAIVNSGSSININFGADTATGGGFNFNLNIGGESLPIVQNGSLPPNALTILGAFLAVIIPTAIFFSLIFLLIGGTVRLGHARYLLDQQDGAELNVGTLFSQFHQFKNGFLLALLTSLFTFLWTLLFFIPGIIASYRYAMAPFIQAENPELTARESLRASKEMMRGHKWKLFCLDLSFIGWALLCIFTLGIGNLFLNPYQSAARAAFYRDIYIKSPGASAAPTHHEWPFSDQINE